MLIENETEMREWVEAIEFALQLQKTQITHHQLQQQQLHESREFLRSSGGNNPVSGQIF
jgi:hypothetical protein